MSPTTRRAACNCGQLSLTIEGEPVRISMCHCLECQRRTGAVISNQERQQADLPLLSCVRVDGLLDRRGLSRLS